MECIFFFLDQLSKMESFSTLRLTGFYGTPVCHGTVAEKHCTRGASYLAHGLRVVLRADLQPAHPVLPLFGVCG